MKLSQLVEGGGEQPVTVREHQPARAGTRLGDDGGSVVIGPCQGGGPVLGGR